ncbi:MAG: chromosome segregation protein SMC, partial [Chitinophagales bacterium]
NLQREIKSNRFRFESQQSELAIFRENLEKAKAEKKAAVEEIEQNKSEGTDLQSQMNLLQKDIDQIQRDRNQLNRQLDSKRNEYKLTKSLVDSLEGFPDSVKFLKTHKKWKVEAPLLLDILNCEDDYKVALENYLAPHLNSYVLEDIEAAMQAIDLLQQAQKGKASFFILSDFLEEAGSEKQEERQDMQELKMENAIPAKSILKVEEKYKPLLHHLLQNVYITSNTSIQSPITNHQSLITQNGQIIRQKASISGGSVGAYEGKRIGRRQQLEQLQKGIGEIEEKQKGLQKEIQAKQNEFHQIRKTLNTKRQLRQHQQTVINKLDNKLVGFRLKVENTEKFIGESNDRTTNLKNRIEATTKDLQILEESLGGKKTELQLQQTKLEESETHFREIAAEMQGANQRFNQHNIEFHKQENRLNSILQNLQFKRKQFQDTQRQLEQNQQILQKGSGESVEIEVKLKEVEGGLGVLYEKKTVLEKEVNESETVYYKLRGQVNEMEEEVRILNRNRNLVDELLTSIKDRTNQLKIQLLSLKERLSFAFKIELDDLLDQSPSGEYEQTDLTAKVAKLQSQLERFGEVNPLAVTAYNEMKERYDFIIEQRADLLTAKESLMKTIQEIEVKATEKFMDAFEKIRVNFVEVFRSLFTPDDQCDLVLQDPNDPLESRIDITAKPKGKRPQSIDQLSGGEKSLTALALIFALYLLKPAPFCVLDEVDAPLDDNNLNKYTRLIERFSKDSQFIIVTHRKPTMAAVDVAYGITMQQQGVSMVVPFNFSEWEAEKG